jgi:hypothetical protein
MISQTSASARAAAWSPSLEAMVEEEVTALEALDLKGLREAWRQRFGSAPKLRSPELLKLVLAWRIQASAWGGLDGAARRQLATSKAAVSPGRDLAIGSRLTREWKGAPVEVIVTSTGFLWRGIEYPSLSAIARAATGTRWNGPRFFGLRDQAA